MTEPVEPTEEEPTEYLNDFGDVVVCDCGGINLTTGAVTLHIEPEDVQAFYELAGAATDLLEGRVPSRRERKRRKRGKSSRTVH